jgi:hypothetical protein
MYYPIIQFFYFQILLFPSEMQIVSFLNNISQTVCLKYLTRGNAPLSLNPGLFIFNPCDKAIWLCKYFELFFSMFLS